MSAPKEYMSKVEIVELLKAEFGISRHAVERKMLELRILGLIHETVDPIDARRLRIPVTDIDIIRRALRGENVR